MCMVYIHDLCTHTSHKIREYFELCIVVVSNLVMSSKEKTKKRAFPSHAVTPFDIDIDNASICVSIHKFNGLKPTTDK